MFYLVRTDDAQAPYKGHVISKHKTLANAQAADHKTQRAARRYSGRTAYVPTAIVQLRPGRRAYQRGAWLLLCDTLPPAEW